MRSGASSATMRATASSTMPAPAAMVSRACASGVSPSPTAAAMPPCAQVLDAPSPSGAPAMHGDRQRRELQRGEQAREARADDDDAAHGAAVVGLRLEAGNIARRPVGGLDAQLAARNRLAGCQRRHRDDGRVRRQLNSSG